MGFWHTGYMDFHEPTSERSGSRPAPPPNEFPMFTGRETLPVR